jgi:hypothetical protein
MDNKMGKINVVKGNYRKAGDENNIWVDRKSALGNPFDMQADENKRDAVCDAFRLYLWEVLQAEDKNKVLDPSAIAQRFNVPISPVWKSPTVSKILERLTYLEQKVESGEEINLICYCHPKKCHAESIAKCVMWRLAQSQQSGVFLEKYDPKKFTREKLSFCMDFQEKTFHIGQGDNLDDSLWMSPLWRYKFTTEQQKQRIDEEIKRYLTMYKTKDLNLFTTLRDGLYYGHLVRIAESAKRQKVKLVYIDDLEHATMIKDCVNLLLELT